MEHTRLSSKGQIEVENPAQMALALAWHAQGMDFADAVPLRVSGIPITRAR